MTKAIKYIGILFCLLFLVLVLVVVSVITFVNPNRFKPLLTEQITRLTGYHATIEGEMTWRFLPPLGIKAEHLILSNSSQFDSKPLAEVDSVAIYIQLKALLHRKIEANGMIINGLTLNVIRDKNGHMNWIPGPSKETASLPTVSNQIKTPHPLPWKLHRVEITKSTIVYTNGRHVLTIYPFELQANTIELGHYFPITMHFTTHNQDYHIKGHVKVDHPFNITGLLAIDHLNIGSFHLSEVMLPFRYDNKQWAFHGFKAKAYQGVLTGDAIFQFPTFTLNGQLTQIDLAALQKDFNAQKSKLSVMGKGDIQFQIVHTKNSVGLARFIVKNGVLNGIDLNYLIDNARALLKGKKVKHPDSHQTAFLSLQGSLILNSGNIQNNALILQTPQLTIKGHGQWALSTKKMEYHLQLVLHASLNQKHPSDNLYGIPVPFIVKGSLQNISIELDTVFLANALLQYHLHSAANKKHHHSKWNDLLQSFLR